MQIPRLLRLLPIHVALLALSATAAAQRIPTVAHWQLDQSSGTAVLDSGPQQHHGTFVGAGATSPWGPGVFGNGLTFDGVDDIVDIAPSANGTLPIYKGRGSAYSVAFWVKAPPQNDRRCYSEGNTGGGSGTGALFTIGTGRTSNGTTDKLQVYIRDDQGQSQQAYSNATVFDNSWHHVAWVDVAGQTALYVDGTPNATSTSYRAHAATTTATSTGIGYTMNKAAIGGVLRATACCHLQGQMDDVRIYAFALTGADVQFIMGNGPPVPGRASIGTYGWGCGAGPLALLASGSAQLGSAFGLQVTSGAAGAPAFLLLGLGPPSPLHLGASGLPNCVLYPSLPNVLVLGALNGAGSSAVLPVPVPNIAGFNTLEITFQGVAVDATGTTAELSPAVIVQMGF